MTDPKLSLADGMRQTRLTYLELWTRCVALGGLGTAAQLQRHVESDYCPDAHEHNIIAQALNDTYLDNGHDHPVAYRHHDEPPRH